VIVCVGLATRDTILKLPRYPGSDERVVATDRVVAGGGPSATAAVAIARLGGDVRFVGAVDALEDVEVIRVPGRPVESTILVTDDARAIVTEDAAPFDLPAGALDGASWVHVDHVGWASLGTARDDVVLSVDAGNPIEGLDPARVDLYGPTEKTFDGRRGKLTVVTLGAGGCRAYDGDETIDVPAFEGVDVVSTLGAGDVFHGALLACLDRGLELRDALRYANACAALSCRALDGRSAIPTWDELEAAVA
jgi:sulfofructose kinase